MRAVALVAGIVFIGGLLVAAIPSQTTPPPAPQAAVPHPHAERIDRHFKQGVVMLHAKRFEYAVAAFDEVVRYAPDLPEAYVNMGYAFVGLERYEDARRFFEKATALRPMQGNAYYGLAMALEGLGDKPGAVGAMRTYLHLPGVEDRYRRKAEAALWEWQAASQK